MAVSTALISEPKLARRAFASFSAVGSGPLAAIGVRPAVLPVANKTKSACCRLSRTICHDAARVGPRAMPRLRSALRQSRFRVFLPKRLISIPHALLRSHRHGQNPKSNRLSKGCITYNADELASNDCGLVFSAADWLTKLSTLSRPLALLRMLFVGASEAGLGAGCLG